MNYLLFWLGIALGFLFITLLILSSRLKKSKQLLEEANIETDSANRNCSDLEGAYASLEKEFKEQIDAINQRNSALEAKYAPLMELDKENEKQQTAIDTLKNAWQLLNEKYQAALGIHASLEKELELYQETLDINSYGLYQPKYNFDLPEQYMVELEGNYNKQREMVKAHTAVICSTEWLVGGSKVEGRKMINQTIKLMLFAFNGECDALIAKVRWNNVSKARDRIIKSFREINKLGSVNVIEIVHAYFDLKLDELSLTYEYEKKRHEQKEEQRLIREQMREEEKAQREFERVHKEAEEEAKMYQKVLDKARNELGVATKEEAEALAGKIKELEEKLKAAQDKKERAISLAQTTKKGNIYVISNVGSFGQDIYKIGMTRRFDPMDRIKELSDAALPFQFYLWSSKRTWVVPLSFSVEEGLFIRMWR
jgi:DNA repair exonuclease SbcCD ATPase subunit